MVSKDSGLAENSTNGATLRNDTLVGAYGLSAGGTIQGTNLIISGSASDDDVYDAGSVTLTDSEYSTTVGNAPTATGTISGAPKFVDAADNNYHVLSTSPGQGQGVDSAANGTLDLDGDLREFDGATDIGAYEQTGSPSATTGSASKVTATTATVAGSIDQAGADVQYDFRYGISTAYGSSTSSTVLTGSDGTTPATGDLTDLQPNTTYHDELVVTAGSSIIDGGDGTLTTLPNVTPLNTVPPNISGATRRGSTLTCSRGTWSEQPTGYTYQWQLDGKPIGGATSATYKLGTADEATSVSCQVTARNVVGASKPVSATAAIVAGCPPATGSVSGTKLGLVSLGMTAARARQVYRLSSTRGYKYKDFFCVRPSGIRVGLGSPKLLKSIPKRERKKLAGRVVWISTNISRYSISGVKANTKFATAERKLRHGYLFRLGANRWYLDRLAKATAVLKIRHGVVQEIGIASKQLTTSHKADRTLMASFQ